MPSGPSILLCRRDPCPAIAGSKAENDDDEKCSCPVKKSWHLFVALFPDHSSVILRCERSEPRRIDGPATSAHSDSITAGARPSILRDARLWRAPQDDGLKPQTGSSYAFTF